jgi:hemoglobin
MVLQPEVRESIEASPPRIYGLTLTEGNGIPHPDTEGITEGLIREVVAEFYRRARRDNQIGPVFEAHIKDWESHLARMNDFWSAALLRTRRYSGRPVEQHRLIDGLTVSHFGRWVELFEDTVCDLCSPRESEAFLVRAQRMRDGMTKILGLTGAIRAPHWAVDVPGPGRAGSGP